MLAVSVIAVALAAATSAPVVADDDDDDDGRRDEPPARTIVGGSLGATLITEPGLAAHLGLHVRGTGRGPFAFRGDLAVDVMPGSGGILSADVAALFVHAINERLELTIGGGPAGGAVSHVDRVDGFFGIVGIATGIVDVFSNVAVGLELRGLAGLMVPSAAPSLASSLSLTTAWRF